MQGVIRGRGVDAQERMLLDYITAGAATAYRQSKMADKVLSQIRRKICKGSYRGLQERWGRGTLVVGLPLWNSVPARNNREKWVTVRSFYERMQAGLADVRDAELARGSSPFKRVEVIWVPNREQLLKLVEGRTKHWADMLPILEMMDERTMPDSVYLSLYVTRRGGRLGNGSLARAWSRAEQAAATRTGRVHTNPKKGTRCGRGNPERDDLEKLLKLTGWRRDNYFLIQIGTMMKMRTAKLLEVCIKACVQRWRYRKHGWFRQVARKSTQRRLLRNGR